MDGSRLARGTEEPLPQKILETARNLSVDLIAAEVVPALAKRGVRSILLKGPSFAGWLYRDGSVRPYADVDLLIAPKDVTVAHGVLSELGFRHLFDSSPYFVREHDELDLHCSIKGVETHEDHVWEVLSAMTELREVCEIELEVLTPEARAMHVALHAAQHGPDWPTPMEDLQRALDMLPFSTWEAAAELAEQLFATASFATGLRLLPTGEAVASRLNLPKDASVETVLRAKSPPPLALGFEELRGIQGVGAKTRFVARKLFPSRSYMRAMMPIARRGLIGLTMAYCRRLVWLSRHAVPGFRAWRQSQREADRNPGSG
jgi:hypothetical protein